MAAYSDFLQTPVGGVLTPTIGVYVQLVSNNTALGYVSDTATDTKGKFTFNTKPPGDMYTVYTNIAHLPALDAGWTLAGDAAYAVPYVAGDSLAIGSATALASSPYAPSAPTGSIMGTYYMPQPSGANDATVLQAILDNGVRGLYQFQPGAYLLDAALAPHTGQTLMGASATGTFLRPRSAITAMISVPTGATGIRISNFIFQPTASQQVATTLAAQLTLGTTYTQMTVATVPAGGWANGATLRIGGTGGGSSQYATINQVGGYAAGGASVVVNISSFKAYLTYAIGAAVQDERYTPSALAADAIRIAGTTANIWVDNCFFYYVNGWCINHVAAPISFTQLTNLYGQHCANGVRLVGSSLLSNIGMDTMEVGESFLLDSASDVQMSNIWGGGYGYGIHIKNNCGAIYINSADMGGLEGYSTPQLFIENPAAGAVDAKPRFIEINNSAFQNGTTGATITDCNGVSFTNCDFYQNGIDGVSITGGDLITMDSCNWRFSNVSVTGATADINVTSTTARVDIKSPRFQSTAATSALIVPATNLVSVLNPILAGSPTLTGANALAGTGSFNGGQFSMTGGWRVPNNITMQSNLAAGGAYNMAYTDSANKLRIGGIDGGTGITLALFANAVEQITMDGTNIILLKQLRRSRQTPTEAVLVSGVDATLGEIVAVTLTAARLVGAPLNPAIGQRLAFTFIQGGVGAFAVTWNAVFKKVWSDTGNATAARSSIAFEYDGTNWNQTGGQATYV